jgi:hypothetical protein
VQETLCIKYIGTERQENKREEFQQILNDNVMSLFVITLLQTCGVNFFISGSTALSLALIALSDRVFQKELYYFESL